MSVLDQLDLFRFSFQGRRAKPIGVQRSCPSGAPFPGAESSCESALSELRDPPNRLLGVRVDTAFGCAERYKLSQEGRAVLLASDAPAGDHASWVERVPGWLTPDGLLFDALMADTVWQKQRREMYDRVVDVPRLLGRPTPGARSTTLLLALSRLLSLRYRRRLNALSLALYRDGEDSVAPHGDKLGPLVADTVVAILSLGHPRTLRLRPRVVTCSFAKKRSLRFELGCGDLFVMGGRCQADWMHGIAKTRHAGPRISVMFREEH